MSVESLTGDKSLAPPLALTDATDRHTHTTEHFVSYEAKLQASRLRFGGFSLANKSLTSLAVTVIRVKRSSVNCHRSNCAMLKWEADRLAGWLAGRQTLPKKPQTWC